MAPPPDVPPTDLPAAEPAGLPSGGFGIVLRRDGWRWLSARRPAAPGRRP